MDLSFIWTIVSFIVVFSLMVIVHEGGHFIVAKMNGVKVYEFMVGMGPAIVKFEKWGTIFSIRALPLGGACMFANPDEADDEEERKEKKSEEKLTEDLYTKKDKTFNDVSAFRRIAILVAGPFANVVLGYFLSLIVVFFCGDRGTVIEYVQPDSPAYEAGLQAGDEILKINGERVYLFMEIRLIAITDYNEVWKIKYKRDGKVYETIVYPRENEELIREIGIVNRDFVDCSNLKMFEYGYYETRYSLKATFKSLRMLFTGKLTKDDVSGPVGVAQVLDTTIENTKQFGLINVILNLINISVLLNVNIGIVNLLPIPLFDGGKILLAVIEAIRGKRIPEKAEIIIQGVTFSIIVVLVILITFNDITKFFRY